MFPVRSYKSYTSRQWWSVVIFCNNGVGLAISDLSSVLFRYPWEKDWRFNFCLELSQSAPNKNLNTKHAVKILWSSQRAAIVETDRRIEFTLGLICLDRLYYNYSYKGQRSEFICCKAFLVSDFARICGQSCKIISKFDVH